MLIVTTIDNNYNNDNDNDNDNGNGNNKNTDSVLALKIPDRYVDETLAVIGSNETEFSLGTTHDDALIVCRHHFSKV